VNIREIVGFAPVIPVLTITELEHAVPLARALSAGGLRVLEITLRTPAADRVGAQFGVTPGLTPELAAAARGARFPLLPGVMTPTELIAARNAGFNVLKLFPAQQAGGIGMLQALGAPFPDVLFCPTGGISRDTAPDYLALPNVVCVGGSWVAPRSLLLAGDWAGIEALARDAASLKKPTAPSVTDPARA
jgi:2-dehydro-3-deoxyphosphogluconate aldolase/(4S)-4-hydroxy-2-oxoglutarate aldolase